MNEGKCVCDLSEGTADKLQIKPDTGQPCCQIGQQCAADTADLFIGQNAAAEQTEGNEKNRNGQDEQHSKQKIDCDLKSQNDSRDITDDALYDRKRKDRQGIAENKIKRRQWGGIQSLEKGGVSVSRDQRCRKYFPGRIEAVFRRELL